MKTIKDCITNYCQGNYHLEFEADNLDKMVEDIKRLLVQEVRDSAEHVDDAINVIHGME